MTCDVTLVIVHRNGPGLLRDCLASLPAACEGITWEAIVVDNGSTDDSVAMVAREFPDVQVIANTDNAGFTRANNQGLAVAKGRYLVLLNNDTISHARCFADAAKFLDGEPRIGVAGLKLLNADGSRQLSARRFPSFQQALFNRYSLLTRLFPNNPYSASYLLPELDEDVVRDVDWVSGACMVLRRELYDEIGGLDERFFMYSEDVDYCQRAWLEGWRVAFVPVASVTHLIGQTSSRFPFLPIIERHRSMYLYYKKHYSRELLFLDVATAAMVLLRCATQLAAAAWRRLRTRGAARPAT